MSISLIYSGILFILLSYLLGSFPFIRMLAKARGVDISGEQDAHSAIWHKVGRIEGTAGILFDALKGALPVIIGFLVDFPLLFIVSAAVAAIIGQMWPVFERFDGEKGNTSGMGFILTLTLWLGIQGDTTAYIILAFTGAPMLLGFFIRTIPRLIIRNQSWNEKLMFGGPVSNSLPIGMITGFILAPVASYIYNMASEITIALTILAIAIIIRRLTAGISTDINNHENMGKVLLTRLFLDRSHF